MSSRLITLKQAVILLLFCSLMTGLAGCKASEAKDAGFVDKQNMTRDPSLPFQRFWMKPALDKSRYTKLYVAPVNLAYMMEKTEWLHEMPREQYHKDLAKLALFTQEAIKKAFREDPHHRMTVLETPTTDTDALIIEVALIEVVPSKVALNALGYAPFGIGLTLSAVRMIANDISTCAFEARISDAATGEIVVTVADREAQQLAPVTLRGLTWYSNAETIITQWSGQFVQLVNRKPGETVKDVEPFTLQPW